MALQEQDLVCQEAVELATDYLDGTLSPSDQLRFEEHLEKCSACREFVEQVRTTIALYGRLIPERLDPQLEEAFLGLYRRWQSGENTP